MPPMLAKAALRLLMSKEGRRFLLVLLITAFVLVSIVVVGVVTGVTRLFGFAGGAEGVPPSARLGLWVPLVNDQAAGSGYPPILELGLISWESGGVWTSTNVNTNGTTDAGLAQINSANWDHYGLTKNPYDPQQNVAASVRILGGALSQYGDDVANALEAYNAGSAARGFLFAPQYAPRVLDAVAAIASGPSVGIYALGAQQTKAGWLAPPEPDPGEVTFVVSGYAPIGPKQTFGGQDWPGLLTPSSLTASAPLTACAQAPTALADLLPPEAACWYATVPATPGQATSLSVVATWKSTQTVVAVGPDGKPHATQAPPVSQSQSLTVTLAPNEEAPAQ